jgi:hypothetical protein
MSKGKMDFFGMPIARYSNGMIKLTISNSVEIEKQINGDKKYGNDEAKIEFDKYSKSKAMIERHLTSIIWTIKMSNSIRGVKKQHARLLGKYIKGMGFDSFLDQLSSGQKSRNLVVNMIKYLASNSDAGRQLSWCSKICKYLDCWYYGKSIPNYQNHFAVYDHVVATVLPYYLKKYRVMNKKKWWWPNDLTTSKVWQNYDSFNDLVGELLHQVAIKDGQSLTKHQLDHLLWYQYKNYDRARLKKAIESYL